VGGVDLAVGGVKYSVITLYSTVGGVGLTVYSALQCTTVYYSTLHYSTLHCTVQCTTVHYSVLQYTVIQCNYTVKYSVDSGVKST